MASLLERHIIINFLSLLTEIPELFYSSVIELLILAHNCFSLTCHMEGITRVLQAARLLTDEHLAPNEEYGLVVRVFDAICVCLSICCMKGSMYTLGNTFAHEQCRRSRNGVQSSTSGWLVLSCLSLQAKSGGLVWYVLVMIFMSQLLEDFSGKTEVEIVEWWGCNSVVNQNGNVKVIQLLVKWDDLYYWAVMHL